MIDLKVLNLPEWVHWLAQDSSGVWWGYQAEPLQNHHGWYENEVGHIIRLSQQAPNTIWQLTLTKIK